MKTYEGAVVQLHAFLTSALDRGELSALLSGRFTSGEKCPRYPLYWRLGWPQGRSGPDDDKISLPLTDIRPRSSSP